MGEPRRHYDEEFKRNAVELSYKSGKTVSQVADDLGIHITLLAKWRKQQKIYGDRAFPGTGKLRRGNDKEEEIRRLKKELADVREERDILKKAMAIFSRTPK
jgi:transposase